MTVRRRWLERGVIVVAAVASIATSRKGWYLEAQAPPRDGSGAQLLVVEASRPTEIVFGAKPLGVEGELAQLRPLEDVQWPGTARYLVPAGYTVSHVGISGKCSGNGCGKCEAPEEDYVRVVKSTRVATWSVHAAGEPQTAELIPLRATWHRIGVTRSHPNVRVYVKASLPPSSIGTYGDFSVHWPDVTAPTTVTWTPHAVMEGPCPDDKSCEPPATAKLEVGQIVKDGYDRTPKP